MNIKYDKMANAAYLYFRHLKNGKKVSKTVEIAPDLVVDFGSKGELIGVEILNAKAMIGSHNLKNIKREKFSIPIVAIA